MRWSRSRLRWSPKIGPATGSLGTVAVMAAGETTVTETTVTETEDRARI